MRFFLLIILVFIISCSNHENIISSLSDKTDDTGYILSNKRNEILSNISTISNGEILDSDAIDYKVNRVIKNVLISILKDNQEIISKFYDILDIGNYNLGLFTLKNRVRHNLENGYYKFVFSFKDEGKEQVIPFFVYKNLNLSIKSINISGGSFIPNEKILIQSHIDSVNKENEKINYKFIWSIDNKIINQGISNRSDIYMIYIAPKSIGVSTLKLELFPFDFDENYKLESKIKKTINIVINKKDNVKNKEENVFMFEPSKDIGDFIEIGSPDIIYDNDTFGYSLKNLQGFVLKKDLNEDLDLNLDYLIKTSFFVNNKENGVIFFRKFDDRNSFFLKKENGNFNFQLKLNGSIFEYGFIIESKNEIEISISQNKLKVSNNLIVVLEDDIINYTGYSSVSEFDSSIVIGTDNFNGIFEYIKFEKHYKEDFKNNIYQLFEKGKISNFTSSKDIKIDNNSVIISSGQWVEFPYFNISNNKIYLNIITDKLSDFNSGIFNINLISKDIQNTISFKEGFVYFNNEKISQIEKTNIFKIFIEIYDNKLVINDTKKDISIPINFSIEKFNLNIEQNIDAQYNLKLNQVIIKNKINVLKNIII